MTNTSASLYEGAVNDPDYPADNDPSDLEHAIGDERVLELNGVISGVAQTFLDQRATISISFSSGSERHDLDLVLRSVKMPVNDSADKPEVPEVRIYVVLPEGWSAR